MVRILEYLAATTMWGLVGCVVYFVDPTIIRDVFIPGLYLPMLVLVTLALAYTLSLFMSRKLMVLIVTIIGLIILSILLIF